MSMSRKHSLKSLMLQVAKDLLEAEAEEKVQERKKYMEEHCPPLCLPRSKEELQALCTELHEKIIVIDEERYNLERKANMIVDEVKDLNIKVVDLKGKFKKPPLKKVRMSADAMLQALLGSKHKVNLDLRANLKQVKKEVKEEDKELRDVGDWRMLMICTLLTNMIFINDGMQELCKKLHSRIDKIDEERYDLESKVNKSNKEIDDLKIKVQDLQGKFKKPALKKVRMSADSMLQALLGSKHKVNLDLRANLKQVKKEVKEESLMLSIAKGLLENESKQSKIDKETYMAQNCPELSLPHSVQELQELCKKLHQTIDKVDEERYDLDSKVKKADKEIEDLKIKVIDLKGKFKKPTLRKVRMSADQMLQALLGSKHKVSLDLRANLKQVKKEVKEESLLLSIAAGLLEAEAKQLVEDKESYINEHCPPLELPGSVQELQDLCKKLNQSIEKADEERYDMEAKVAKTNKEIDDLKIKVQDLKGKFKKPVLRKVRMSADQMLQALLGSKHKVSLDLRANLKQVKKEVKEESVEQVGDWRKNIEDKAGMDGRKKMFESEA
ncbi:hypothetical protein QTP86_018138 [Hemibagrus guttatus]|nr:hypothetical protein QTP86_018138 [Hemibagrus guttatus]